MVRLKETLLDQRPIHKWVINILHHKLSLIGIMESGYKSMILDIFSITTSLSRQLLMIIK